MSPLTNQDHETFGIALSGGGSRAAAFHRGILSALAELKSKAGGALIDRANVVSTVSGGSLFGGAWLAARADGIGDDEFLAEMREQLSKGFIGRSVTPKMAKLLVPGYTRTNIIAETFDRTIFHGKRLADMPEKPQICINATVLNNGQVGKFSRDGFSVWGLKHDGSDPAHLAPMREFPLALAVAASAAFPVGLPPVVLKRRILPPNTEFVEDLRGAKDLALTDGGVLENLGLQTLLKSRRFACRHIVLSDAGVQEKPWKPGAIRGWTRSIGASLTSGGVLDRVMLIMNAKQNRWTRQQAIEEIYLTQLSAVIANSRPAGAAIQMLAEGLGREPRRLLFVRVNQNWRNLLKAIPRYHLAGLAERAGVAVPDGWPGKADGDKESFLAGAGVILRRAKEIYNQMGSDDGAERCNAISTSFAKIKLRDLDILALHSQWQVHATHAIYGFV